MLTLQNISYVHPDKNLQFNNVSLTVNNHEKIALIGKNGSGKSTLLQLAAGFLMPTEGKIYSSTPPYFVPQMHGEYHDMTIGEVLKIDKKLHALKEILQGCGTVTSYQDLDDEWDIEERYHQALQYWQLPCFDFSMKLSSLSGGQKTKIFLAGISMHQPDVILMDEPSNHLDEAARILLSNFILSANAAIILVSHDRTLLNQVNVIYEIHGQGLITYGGNYEFYKRQKEAESNSLKQDLDSNEKELRKARDKEKEVLQRQQKKDHRGKGKKEKEGVARIMMNTYRNNAEKSTSRLRNDHSEKIENILKERQEIQKELQETPKMKFGFNQSFLHTGKVLLNASNINYEYSGNPVWKNSLSFTIYSGERIALKGNNGSGKTTLIRLITGNATPLQGTIQRAEFTIVYIDQEYSIIEEHQTVYGLVWQFNDHLEEYEIKISLNRFLFRKDDWNRPCSNLSGGEKMRLMLCCLNIRSQAPDMIILDEPTNNLDIQNIEVLTSAILDYKGTLMVVCHDETFMQHLNLQRTIQL